MGADADSRASHDYVALWFDCDVFSEQAELKRACADRFRLERGPDDLTAAQDAIAQHKPSLLVFDFDYALPSKLRQMQMLKRAEPSIPLLMLTLEHSEGLAVWAFRSKVWNYLVKPVAVSEFRENVAALHEVAKLREQRAASYVASPAALPLPRVAAGDALDDSERLQPAIRHVAIAYHERLSAADLAERCRMSRFEFSRRFRRTYGMAFQEYLLRLRISEACRHLSQGTASITDVGHAVGFSDGSYFARIFRRYTGRLPSEYARRFQQGAEPRHTTGA